MLSCAVLPADNRMTTHKSVIKDQSGAALMFVTMVGLVVSIVFAAFMGSTIVNESRAVEAELANSRVYWAQMGNHNYALSRIAASKLCNGCSSGTYTDAVLVPVLQAYYNELNNYNTWTYLDEAAAYSITITTTAAADPTPGRHSRSGWLMGTPIVTPSSVVAGFASKSPLMELRFCVGLAGPGDKCKKVNETWGGSYTPYYSTSRLTNLPSL